MPCQSANVPPIDTRGWIWTVCHYHGDGLFTPTTGEDSQLRTKPVYMPPEGP